MEAIAALGGGSLLLVLAFFLAGFFIGRSSLRRVYDSRAKSQEDYIELLEGANRALAEKIKILRGALSGGPLSSDEFRSLFPEEGDTDDLGEL